LATSFVVGNTLFLLLHETGRVRISQVHLPVLHLAVVLGQARPLHATERPWTSYSAISPFSDSTSNGGCRFSGVWPQCTRFGSLDSGRVIRDVARGTGDAGLRIGFTPVPHTWACARICNGSAMPGRTARPAATATLSMLTSMPCTPGRVVDRGGPGDRPNSPGSPVTAAGSV
jgi:hypothetical protein